MTIEERVKRLEQDNRRLRFVVAALACAGLVATGALAESSGVLVAAAAVVFFGAALAFLQASADRAPSVLRATKLEIVGADGCTRVAVGETIDGTGAIATYDAAGRFIAAVPPCCGATTRPRATQPPSPRPSTRDTSGLHSTRRSQAVVAD